MKTICAAALGFLIFASVTSANAKSFPAAGVTPEELQAWMTAQGYPATLKADESECATCGEGVRVIVQSVSNEVNYDVYFYDCKNGRCATLQFAAGWTECTSSEMINSWNTKKRWIRAYQIPGNICWGEMDFVTMGGLSEDAMGYTFRTWLNSLGLFRNMMDSGALVSSNEVQTGGAAPVTFSRSNGRAQTAGVAQPNMQSSRRPQNRARH